MKTRIATPLLLPLFLLLFAGQLEGAEAQPCAKDCMRIRLVDSNPTATAMPFGDYPVPSYFFTSGAVGAQKADDSKLKRGWFRNVYLNVDLVCYGDDSHVEYVFVVYPGGDPSMIRLAYEGPRKITMDHSGKITIQMSNSEISQSKPVVQLQAANSRRQIDGSYNIDDHDIIDITPGSVFNHQVNNDQFVQFLNSAQANSSNAVGANMYFDKDGDVWFSQPMKDEANRMFNLAESRLAYDKGHAFNLRYYYKDGEHGKEHFAGKPVIGVSWIGAMKYCNWLTIRSGRGIEKRVYNEGTNLADWSPMVTNWPNCIFQALSADESKGFSTATAYLPNETFMIHILYSFYMEPGAAVTEEKLGEKQGGPAEEVAPETEGVAGEGTRIKIDVNVPSPGNEIMPNGLAYKEQPSAPPAEEVVPPGAPSGGGGETPSAPPTKEVGPGPSGPVHYTLTVLSVNPPMGVLIDATPDINGAAGGFTVFSRTYNGGQSVTLTAPAFSSGGNPFVEWQSTGGIYVTTNETVTFSINSSTTMTAVYAGPVRLTVSSAWPPAGLNVQVSTPDVAGLTNGTTTFFRDYYSNTTVTLIAPASYTGIIFLRWLKDGTTYTTSPTATVTLVTDTTMTAIYEEHNLRVRSSAPGVGVSITESPNDVNGLAGANTPFDRLYHDGAVVTLVAAQVAPNGNVFQKWLRNGVNYDTNRTTSVTMDMDYTMTAAYVYVPEPIPEPPVSPSGL